MLLTIHSGHLERFIIAGIFDGNGRREKVITKLNINNRDSIVIPEEQNASFPAIRRSLSKVFEALVVMVESTFGHIDSLRPLIFQEFEVGCLADKWLLELCKSKSCYKSKPVRSSQLQMSGNII